MSWWLEGGVTAGQCAAAYQPIGAASLAASYSNLNNPGTNDAAPGVAPTWDATNGWIFNGLTQYLTTGIVPASGWSMIVRFSNFVVGGYGGWLCGSVNTGNTYLALSPNLALSSNVLYGEGSYLYVSPAMTAGNLAVAGQQGYRNGSADGGAIGAWSGTGIEIYIGDVNGFSAKSAEYIQALAIYNINLSAAQVSAIYTAMAGLGAGPTYTLAAAQGGYTLTGEATALQTARKLVLAQGSYSLTGEAVGLPVSRKLLLAQGGYALTGEVVALQVARKLLLAQGSYLLTGEAIALQIARKLLLAQGAYVLTGEPVEFTYTPVGGPTYTLHADYGSLVLTGESVALKVARNLTMDYGAYTLTGQAAALKVSRQMLAAYGQYALTGEAIALQLARKLALALGTYVLTGRDVTLFYSGATTPTPAARIFTVPGELRIYTIPSEDRTFRVQ